jgi:hypothetical protein
VKLMWRATFAIAMIAFLASSVSADARRVDYRSLTPRIIERIEAKIIMPLENRPLNSYARYYTLGHLSDGSPYIFGVFLSVRPNEGFWKIVSPSEMRDIDRWSDGGCGRLSFGAYFRTLKIDQPLCNFG